jgi:hypothetical protein
MPLALLANALLGFTLRKKFAFNKANFHHILVASFNVVAIIRATLSDTSVKFERKCHLIIDAN